MRLLIIFAAGYLNKTFRLIVNAEELCTIWYFWYFWYFHVKIRNGLDQGPIAIFLETLFLKNGLV
jgi:hypothetical protein